jgi:hypothetical protein
MIYQKLKRILASLALSGLILSSGLICNSVALAKARTWVVRTETGDKIGDLSGENKSACVARNAKRCRGSVRDRQHRLRYRMNNQTWLSR